MEGAVGIGPAAIVTGLQQALDAGRQLKFGIAGIFFLQQALGGGVVLVHQGVLGAVGQHVAVGEAHGGVGVRVQGHAFLPLQEGGGKVLAGNVEGGIRHGVQGHVGGHEGLNHSGAQFNGRVCGNLVCGGSHEAGLGGEHTLGKKVFHVRGNVQGGKIAFANLQVVGRVRRLAVMLQQGHRCFLVDGSYIVLILFTYLFAGIGEGRYGVLTRLQGTSVQAGHGRCKLHQLNLIRAFDEAVHGDIGRCVFLHILGDIGHRVPVQGLALRRSLDPGLQIGLFLLFAADDVEGLEGQLLTLPLLPAVGGGSVFVGIFETDGRVGHHLLPHDVLADGAGVNADAVVLNHAIELGGGLVALRATRVAQDHGIVAFLYALGGNLEAAGGLVGDVELAVFGRHVVGPGVYAEHGEVAGVAGPHPVVRFSAELAHGCRGSAHKAYVRIGPIHNDIVHIVVVEARDGDAAAGIGGLCVLFEVIGRGALLLNGVRDVFHAHQEGDGEAGAGDFLAKVLGPVTIHEVVVLVRGQALDAAVTAVVVGDQETLVADHFTGAAAAKVDDGVFQGGFVDGVDFLRSQLAAGRLEVFSVELFQEGQEPHSFVGHGAHRNGKAGQDCENTFHYITLFAQM